MKETKENLLASLSEAMTKYGDYPEAVSALRIVGRAVDSIKYDTCKACGEPMEALIRSHHHTKNGVDVTK